MSDQYSVNSGKNHPRYKGGRYVKNGYVLIFVPDCPWKRKDNTMLEHRYIMSVFLGRGLGKNELVHHINGNTQDNRIKNLQIVSPQEHSARTIGSKLKLCCPYCNKTFEVPHR